MRSAPSRAATPCWTLDQSASGTPGGGGATIGPLLRGELLKLQGEVPRIGQDALALVVSREPSDLRFEELETAQVRQVLRVRLEVGLEVHGLPHEVAEVLGRVELRAPRAHDLRHGL